MIKILHFADAHIDMANYGRHDPETGIPFRIQDFLKSLDTIVDTAIAEKVDLVLFAGDAYKDRTPAPTYQREWGKRMMRLSKAGILTLLLVGNHDISPSVGRAYSFQEFDTLEVPHIRLLSKPGLMSPSQLEDKPVQIIALPWITRGSVAAALMTTESAENNDPVEHLQNIYTQLVDQWLQNADPSIPVILLAHASVEGATYGAERLVMLGNDLTLSPGLVKDHRIAYTALGHIHKKQDLNEGGQPPVVYPGSIERVDFGEAGDQKYFVIAEVEKGNTRVEFRQLTGIREFIDRRVSLTDSENTTEVILKALPAQLKLKDAIIRLTLEYPREMDAQIDENTLREYTKDAFEFHFIRHPTAETRIRLEKDQFIGQLPVTDLTQIYWNTIHVQADEQDILQKMVDAIIQENPESIHRSRPGRKTSMIPIKLTITNFLSYHQKVEIDFSTIHLACISGNNGAGKSTLIDAITWAMFGKARRTDDALIHGLENDCEVIFDFAYENDTYRIRRSRARGKTGEIDLFMYIPESDKWLPYSEKSLRETESRIQQILRMDFETFSNASFFLQGKADQFAQQKPGDRKRILSSILGLDIWEVYKERAASQRKSCEQKVNLIDSRMDDIRLELGEENQRKEHLDAVEQDLKISVEQRNQQELLLQTLRQVENSIKEQQKGIDTLSKQLTSLQAKQKETENRLAMRQDEKSSYKDVINRADLINASYQQLVDVRKRLEEMNALAMKVREIEKELVDPGVAIEKSKTALEMKVSQLVDLGLRVEKLIPELQIKQNQLTQVCQQIASLEPVIAGKSELEEKKNHLSEQVSDLRSENNRLNAEMQEIKDRREHLSEVHGANCPLCGQDMSETHRGHVLEDLLKQGTLRGDQYRTNQQRIQQLEAELREIQLGIQEIQLKEKENTEKHRLADQLRMWINQNEPPVKEWEELGIAKLEETRHAIQTEDYCQAERKLIADLQKQLSALNYHAAIHTDLQQEEISLRGSEQDHQRLDQASAVLKQLEREIEDMSKEIEQNKREIESQTQLFQSASDSYQQLASQFTDPRSVEKSVNDLTIQVNKLQQEVGAAKQRVNVLASLKTKLDELSQERETHSQQVGRYKTLEKAFGKDGVPALLIEQALPEIELEANDILEKLSGGMMRVNFLTQRDFKDKNRDDKKETLDIQISDVNGTRDYELYSGGEAFRINFAIRLAMSKMLAKRAGARLQTLVIDEGFGSQDASGRQRLIEAIRLVQDDFAKVLVITHLEELKDAFPHRIEVEKGPTGSTVRVIS